ncbi:MAG: hypothetical protein JNN12_13380 [Bacteroidetes Order II. Incertae sedis bacterium]|nr:hypothetical protein [Bacteroidetes Order II. bacterium]
MKYTFYCFLFGMMLSTMALNAQPQSVTLTGKLQKRAWAKTLESYCAQGSDYYVLTRPRKKSVVLSLDTEADADKFDGWINRKVQVQGEWMSRTISPNPQSQYPVTPTFPDDRNNNETTCKIFQVTTIRLMASK